MNKYKIEEGKIILSESTTDKVGSMWFVTKPTKLSELGDIVFEADIKKIMLQSRGGLDYEDIILITKNQKEAEKKGEELLSKR